MTIPIADKIYIQNLYSSKHLIINLQQAEDIIKEYYQFQKFIDAVKNYRGNKRK